MPHLPCLGGPSCTDMFVPTPTCTDLKDLGPTLHRVMVGHQEDGEAPRWRLESIRVDNLSMASDAPFLFTCGEGGREGGMVRVI